MPSIFTHFVVGFAAGAAWNTRAKPRPKGLWALSVICAGIPDLDLLGNHLGVPYGGLLGHRGFTHSLCFAALLSALVVFAFYRKEKIFSRFWWILFAWFFAVTATHGILDAFVVDALGPPLFAPFLKWRFHSPWSPIIVSPITIRDLFSPWGLSVFRNEIPWIWLPLWTGVGLWKAHCAMRSRARSPREEPEASA